MGYGRKFILSAECSQNKNQEQRIMQKEYQVADSRTSNLSAVNIGHNSVTDRHKTLRRVFKEEPKEISEFTKGVHYSRKDCYMQTAYSSTVNKMCDAQARSSGLDK